MKPNPVSRLRLTGVNIPTLMRKPEKYASSISFVMVLGYSRAIYVEFTNRCDVRTFIRCLIHGFEYFGGVSDVVLTGRMKTVILGTGENKKPLWNPTFEDLAATLGFTPKVCRARRSQTKVKAEIGNS